MNVDTTSQRLQASNMFDNVYAKSVILEGELSSAEMQVYVGNNYGKLQFLFNNFPNIRQATLTDMFSRSFSSKLMSIALFAIFLK